MRVSFSLDMLTRLVHGFRPLWIEAGNVESTLLARTLKTITIDRPIFISGLARSGSTLLLEFIADHNHVATHQYRDFPFIFTPYFSRRLSGLLSASPAPQERAHGDGMLVSPSSPEAMEEMLWLAFAKHDTSFIAFYRAHIQKLLFAAHASRYAAKNNNLITRLPRLLDIFPDARVIIPVRDPVTHIGSLMRQHERFNMQANNPRAIRHLRAQGHFEFGPTRHWQSGDEIRGWAQQWSQDYAHVIPYLNHENILMVPFEALCEAPQAWLHKIAQHTMLELQPEIIEQFSRNISQPSYYDHSLSEGDIRQIRALTDEINMNFTQPML